MNVISLNATPPEPEEVKADDLNTLMRLIDLLADPKAAKAKIAELRDAAAEYEKQLAAATAANDAADEHKRQVAAELMAAHRQHTAKLDQERTTHDASVAARNAECDARERQTKQALAEAEAARAAANVDREECRRRIAAMEGRV